MTRWAEMLRANLNRERVDPEEAEENTLKELHALYDSKSTNISPHQETKTMKTIPRFFYSRQPVSDLKSRVGKESRARFLEQKLAGVPSGDEMESLWVTLGNGQTARINFAEFQNVAEQTSPKIRGLFTSALFWRFPQDDAGRISSGALFRYIVTKIRRVQVRVPITCYDTDGNGFLTEHDLENYVFEQLPHMRQLAGMAVEFYPYYVFTAVRKFLFFLDPLKKRRIKISDIVQSKIFEEFTALHEPLDGPEDEQQEKLSWFSARSAWQVYGSYLQLDIDHNGMLSKTEFSRFNGGSLTQAFVDGLFAEYRMYESPSGELEMDYKTYLDFILAMESKSSPEAVKYFFKILDINHVGYLDVFTLLYFFKAVHSKMVDLGHDVSSIQVEDVVQNELFDMIKPQNKSYVTVKDLLTCKCAHTVFSIVMDVNGFWKYDNRELLMVDSDPS